MLLYNNVDCLLADWEGGWFLLLCIVSCLAAGPIPSQSFPMLSAVCGVPICFSPCTEPDCFLICVKLVYTYIYMHVYIYTLS